MLMKDENIFTINPHSPKRVIIKRKYIKLYDSDGIVHTYNITDPDVTYFLFNTTLETDSFLDESLLNFL